jgi:hypothetical protein
MREAASRKSRVLEAAVIEERRLEVGILAGEEHEVEERRCPGGRREQDGERRGLEENGAEEAAVGLRQERRRTGRNEVPVADKKLVAMAAARSGLQSVAQCFWSGTFHTDCR